MASPLIQDDETTGNPQQNTTTTSGTSSAGGASGGTTPGSTTPQNSPQANVNQIDSLNQGFDFSPLLSYVQGQGTTARNAISGANNTFNTGLGAFGAFGPDQQTTLAGAISGAQPLSAGRSILNTAYSGPQGVDRTTYDPQVNQYVQSANQTTNASGVDSLLGSLRPDLTPGERSYDALVFGQNPTYQQKSRALVNDANDVQGLADSTATNASGAATKRQSDVNAFNQAGSGYVQSQRDAINSAIGSQMQQANTYDQGVQNLMGQISTGQSALANAPRNELNFDPNAYQPQAFTSTYGPDVFNQTVNPSQYLTYNNGALATRGNVATPDQVTQYNNAENLLGLNDQLVGGLRQGATMGINQQAFQAALQQAQQELDAANAGYLAAHQPVPTAATTAAKTFDAGTGGQEGGGNGNGGDSTDASDQASADQAAADSTNAGGDPSGSDAGSGGAGGAGAGAGGSSGGSAGDGPGGNDNGGFAKGGLVKLGKSSAEGQKIGGSYGQKLGDPPAMMGGQQDLATLMAHKGGYIRPGTSPNPAIKDDIPARVDDGEFVTRRSSVNDIGPQNMAGLNKIDQAPPAQQMALRNALHAALGRAFGNGGMTGWR